MKTFRSALFWVLAAALLAGHLVLAWNSLVVWRFWEDEAFNLTVPLNLLSGLGYTSDGALSGSTLTPFDPRISTGPVVLLPVAAMLATGIDPVIGGRLIPLAYWALLLAGLFVLGRRISGRWAALAAVAVPLAFTTGVGVSPIQGPADLLGEIPAAALLVWALVVLPRRTWLAGLLVGLAVQAKLIALLALPAFAVALWLLPSEASTASERVKTLLKRSWVPLLFVALPTFLVELFALVSLGLDGFIMHLRELWWFIRSGGQGGEPTTVVSKLTTLADSWSLPVWAAVVLAVVSIGLIAAGLWVARGSDSAKSVSLYVWPAFVGALAFVGWWATASHLPLWVRHPAPGVFAFFPILTAAAVWACVVLFRRRTTRVVAVVAASVLALGIGAGSVLHVVVATTAARWETLVMQRDAVEPLAEWVAENDAEWLAAAPWGAAVSPIVLSGAHVGLWDAPAMNGVPRLTGAKCTTDVLADSGRYRICAAE
ncbi:hypothetical protein [Microbacterium sp.]|uniref:hypothetical protein n=1 Tax=Microbacterium sp. TaxID=51671 RepID=UPI002C1D5F39|nr:hypothetical protein [Microbacterium sp.]HWK76510.1 hypothetical protein [Microbacterium sp.]